jgi:hypothetical protein
LSRSFSCLAKGLWPSAEKSGVEIYTWRISALWAEAIIENPILGDPVSSINFSLDKNT